ncbi:MAG: hypothetical protein N2255_07130 [Kiritimatiellae bacterium]|nr:hypothetical protein [Kiritimatiellia bacterium]
MNRAVVAAVVRASSSGALWPCSQKVAVGALVEGGKMVAVTDHGYRCTRRRRKGPEMDKPVLETRTRCPACESRVFREIFSVPYDRPPISTYLLTYYRLREQELRMLEGASYVLCECSVCRLIFQLHIPDAAFMSTLYER